MKFTFLVVIPTTRASSASCWPRFGRNHIFFVDRVQDSGGRPLDDLVLKGGGYRECALPTVRFGDVNPSGWQRSIRSSMKPCVQVRDIAIEVRLVGLPCQPIHSRCGILLELKERRPKVFQADVMQERGELFSFVLWLATCRMRSSAWDTFSRF